MADPLQHAPFARAERRYVAGPPKIGRHGFRIDGDADRLGAILRADTGGHSETLVGVDADRERGSILVGVYFALLRELELIGPLARKRQANPPAGLADHEVDHLGRDQLRRANQIAFVLAIFIVGEMRNAGVCDRHLQRQRERGGRRSRRIGRHERHDDALRSEPVDAKLARPQRKRRPRQRHDIRLDVHPRSGLQVAEIRMTQGVFDERKLQTAGLESVHG